MKVEDLFKYGVTPKKGPKKGQKFSVESVEADGINAISGEDKVFFTHGEYDLYRDSKSLFEDSTVAPTWGNLKKAMEEAGLDDDTQFAVPSEWPLMDYATPARFRIEKLREPYEKPKKFVVVR